MQPAQIKTWLAQCFTEAEIEVVGDGRHFEAIIISPVFTAKSTLQRHRMVYAALGDKVGNEIHALSIKAFTPEERGDL